MRAAKVRVLDGVWNWLLAQPFFHLESFEPLLSSVCFIVFIVVYWSLDLTGVSAKYLIDPANDSSWEKKGVPSTEKWSTLFGYLVPLLVFDHFFPRRHLLLESAAAEGGAPSLLRVLTEVLTTIVIYDVLFVWIHFAFHKVPFLWQFHSKHHRFTSIRAGDTIRLSFIDGALQVFCNILALNLIGAHPISRALHDIAVTYLLTENHAGMDAPWHLHRFLPFLAGPRRHFEHHAHGKAHFHQFFMYLDSYLDRTG